MKWGMWKKLMRENEEMRGGAIWDMGHKATKGKIRKGFPFLLFRLMPVSVRWGEMTQTQEQGLFEHTFRVLLPSDFNHLK